MRHKTLNENEITPKCIEQAYNESLEDLEIFTEIDAINISDDGQFSNISPSTVSTSINNGNTAPPRLINDSARVTGKIRTRQLRKVDN